MSLRATKSLARTLPGCLHCSKHGFGVEKQFKASYVPLHNLGDIGSASDPDVIFYSVLDRVEHSVDCRVDMGGPNSLLASPVISVPMGPLSCSRKGYDVDNRLSTVLYPKQEDCSEYGF